MRVILYLICAQKHACCLPKHLLEPAVKHCFVRTCLSTIACSRIILKMVSGLIWYNVWMFYLRGIQFLWFCALALHCKAIYNLRINEMPWMAQGFLAVCISTSPTRNKRFQTFFCPALHLWFDAGGCITLLLGSIGVEYFVTKLSTLLFFVTHIYLAKVLQWALFVE